MLRVITFIVLAHAVFANTLSKHHKTQMLRVQKTTTHVPVDESAGDYTTWDYEVMCINCFEPSKRVERQNDRGFDIKRSCTWKNEIQLREEGSFETCGKRDSDAAMNVLHSGMCTNNENSHPDGCSLDDSHQHSAITEGSRRKVVNNMKPNDQPTGHCCKDSEGKGVCRQDFNGPCSKRLKSGKEAEHTIPHYYTGYANRLHFVIPCVDFKKKVRCPATIEETEVYIKNGMRMPDNS